MVPTSRDPSSNMAVEFESLGNKNLGAFLELPGIYLRGFQVFSQGEGKSNLKLARRATQTIWRPRSAPTPVMPLKSVVLH